MPNSAYTSVLDMTAQNPLELRPKVICILVPPGTPDKAKLDMASASAEAANLGWAVRTGGSPAEVEIAKAAGKKGLACFMSDKPRPDGVALITPEKLDNLVIDRAVELFEKVIKNRKADAKPVAEEHLYRAIEQMLALGGSQLNYTSCARCLLSWWPEKRSSWSPSENWPVAVEAVHFARTSPEFPFSANIVNLDNKRWQQGFYVTIPELRERMPSFTLSEIDHMTIEDGNQIPF